MEFVKTLKRVVPRKLHRHLGVTRRWLRTIPPQVRLQKEQLLSDPSLSDGERESDFVIGCRHDVWRRQEIDVLLVKDRLWASPELTW